MRARPYHACNVRGRIRVPVVEGGKLEYVRDQNELPDGEQEGFRSAAIEAK
jgi:hypothetical protein